jgi:tetratricopeptide (TPR) repeat protein
MHEYDPKDFERRFGVTESVVRSLIRAGHIQPQSNAGRLNFSFQDLIVMRTATALRAAKIPTRAINRALRRIRSTLPEGLPLSAQSLSVVGNRIALRDGQVVWESDSGQYALPLEAAPTGTTVNTLHPTNEPVAALLAEPHFAIAYEVEESDPDTAVKEYKAALLADPRHAEARINLGRLLHLRGNHLDAEAVYRGGAPHPLLLFNLAVLLEDLNRNAEAIAVYREALAADPELPDAHFNLARLYELSGDARAALRHLLAYRRSQAHPDQ